MGSSFGARRRSARNGTKGSPSRVRFRPPPPSTFRPPPCGFRVRPPVTTSTYSRPVLGARRTLRIGQGRRKGGRKGKRPQIAPRFPHSAKTSGDKPVDWARGARGGRLDITQVIVRRPEPEDPRVQRRSPSTTPRVRSSRFRTETRPRASSLLDLVDRLVCAGHRNPVPAAEFRGKKVAWLGSGARREGPIGLRRVSHSSSRRRRAAPRTLCALGRSC